MELAFASTLPPTTFPNISPLRETNFDFFRFAFILKKSLPYFPKGKKPLMAWKVFAEAIKYHNITLFLDSQNTIQVCYIDKRRSKRQTLLQLQDTTILACRIEN